MSVDIRGEMEAVAAEMETAGADFSGDSQDASPASVEATSETTESPETPSDSPATEGAPQEPKAESQPPDDYELPVGGSIPVPRVRKIIENARTKERAQVEAQLAWAKQYDAEKVNEAMKLVQFATENPVEYYHLVTAQLRKNPELAPQVERVWSQYQQQQQPPVTASAPKEDPNPKPTPDVLLEDGRLVYSSAQMEKLLEWQERRFDEAVNKKFKPIEERELEAKRTQALDHEAQRVLKDVMTWQGMDNADNRKAVAEAMIQHRLPVEAAYRMAVLPKLTDTKAIEDRVRKQVMDELKKKSRASTPNPQVAVADQASFKGKSIREILEATADELGID